MKASCYVKINNDCKTAKIIIQKVINKIMTITKNNGVASVNLLQQ